VATDNDTSFDAALAALDVEPTHHNEREERDNAN